MIMLATEFEPISINKRYVLRGKRGHKKQLKPNSKYNSHREWLKHEFQAQYTGLRMTGAVSVEIQVPENNQDIDANIKMILDSLVGVVYRDDKQVKVLKVSKVERIGILVMIEDLTMRETA